MSEFIKFRKAIQKQFDKMAASGTLFMSEASKDEVWDTYLNSFPQGTNELFRERTEHDCVCCKQFIRNVGRVLGEVDGKLVSVWDLTIDNFYQEVANALKDLNLSKGIGGLFLHNEREIGKLTSIEKREEGEDIVWDHFHQVVPQSAYRKEGIAEEKGNACTNRKVLKRSLEGISSDSVETVLELIDQNSIYRGEEHRQTLNLLSTLQREYNESSDKDLYLWKKAVELKGVCALRNTVIGTLVTDITKGVELEVAVKKFEDKVAPSNYKRSKALVTPRIKEDAKKKAQELGIEPSFLRRHATKEDISVGNVLFADQSVAPFMEDSIFDTITTSNQGIAPKNFDKIQEVSVDKFVKDVLPSCDSIELYLDNSLDKHLMTLVAPVNPCAPKIFKWGNNFSWSYNGDVADSLMKERVKSAGGVVEGDLRFSIQWNDTAPNLNDLDAHCKHPAGLIYFSNKRDYASGGSLDVDITSPKGVAVENIIFPNKDKMEEGVYTFMIHNYSERGGRNWEAQVEFNGEVFDYSYEGGFSGNSKQTVAIVKYTKSRGFELTGGMENSTSTKEIWGLETKDFHKVNMVMNSPNHWDGESTGNKHLFFILEGCKNPDSVRGFYNEYLSNELTPHRKVFEVLGAQLKAEYQEEQLSGVGISSTLDKEVVLRVKGKTTRLIKVKF